MSRIHTPATHSQRLRGLGQGLRQSCHSWSLVERFDCTETSFCGAEQASFPTRGSGTKGTFRTSASDAQSRLSLSVADPRGAPSDWLEFGLLAQFFPGELVPRHPSDICCPLLYCIFKGRAVSLKAR